MLKETRNLLFNTTQAIRRLLEEEFSLQLEGTFDVHAEGRVAEQPGSQLSASERLVRGRIVEAIQHRLAVGESAAEAVRGFQSEAVFTFLNRLAALKMMEARDLVLPCVSQGDQSQGFKEFSGLAPGLIELPDKGYRLYLECLFDEIGREVGVLFDRTDAASQLWPRRKALEAVLAKLNTSELAGVWAEDETIGWIYQYYNDPEERKQMREESSAPRNSRELAVRNQFFTPRYVVEFLTDNTLGRIWYEMTQGQTRLRDKCRYLVRRSNEIFLAEGQAAPTPPPDAEPSSQVDLIKQQVHIPHRPLKDPREIRMIDPACGSMHFGLYAFDLFTVMYDEAWELAHGMDAATKSATTFAPFVTFAASFADKASFLREAPRLIVEHNIHGIDIDPRAAQIAGLALWLRAQKTWQGLGLKAADRPAIHRSNIVCAEPMPGERELLREFIEQHFPATERPLFLNFLASVWEKMRLAGEAGSLLKIEEEIRTLVTTAKQQWKDRPRAEQIDMFPALGATPAQVEMRLDLSGITDEQFWERAEQRIYGALAVYAEQAENGGGFQRRLFANDAAQGFAFIDLCRKRYDVVVMNPPFGKCSDAAEAYFREAYPNNWKELYAAFFERTLLLLIDRGSVASISSSQFLYTKQMQALRAALMATNAVECFVELGLGVLDGATVDTALSVLAPERHLSHRRTLYLDIAKTELAEKPAKLLQSVTEILRFTAFSITQFARLETNPFCFHAAPELLSLWNQPERFDPDLGRVATGNHTFEDWRFLRLRWEVNPAHIATIWIGYEKGGEYQPFISPTPLVVNWAYDGGELRTINREHNGTEAQVMQSSSLWLRSGICYSHVSSVAFGPRVLPAGHIFSSESISIFPKEPQIKLKLLGLLSSTITQDLIWCYGRYRKIENRAVSNLPFSQSVIASLDPRFGDLASQAILEVQRIEGVDEASPLFVSCILRPQSLTSALKALNESNMTLKALCDELDALSEAALFSRSNLPALQAKRRSELTDVFSFRSIERDSDATSAAISQIVGYVFGRWDIRYATGERPTLELPDPFAPLPVCPPGMLQGDDGLPLSPSDGHCLQTDGRYPLDVAWDGILVDDPNHPADIIGRVQEVLRVIWKDRADAIEHEACEILGVKSLRDWLRKPAGFFADHLKRYSKSRRQAPIYWPLSSPNGLYTVWLYYHRLTADTLFTVLRDYLKPKLEFEERRAFQLRQESGTTPSPSQRRDVAEAEELVEDLRAFKAELERIAPLFHPNLNDGVIINCAPLWRMIGLPKWRKDCQAVWTELAKGDYDWAHLALHLWPERVVPKCATDRSLAIAHGLEAVFWQEDPEKPGKWIARKVTETEVRDLIAERTSAAVKAAVEELSIRDQRQGSASASGARKRGRKANAQEELL